MPLLSASISFWRVGEALYDRGEKSFTAVRVWRTALVPFLLLLSLAIFHCYIFPSCIFLSSFSIRLVSFPRICVVQPHVSDSI